VVPAWLQIPDMHERRGAHACTAGPGGLLYVIGGYEVTRENPFMSTGEIRLGCLFALMSLGCLSCLL